MVLSAAKRGRFDTKHPVILSEAKDLMPVANGDEVLRCTQDDTMPSTKT